MTDQELMLLWVRHLSPMLGLALLIVLVASRPTKP